MAVNFNYPITFLNNYIDIFLTVCYIYFLSIKRKEIVDIFQKQFVTSVSFSQTHIYKSTFLWLVYRNHTSQLCIHRLVVDICCVCFAFCYIYIARYGAGFEVSSTIMTRHAPRRIVFVDLKKNCLQNICTIYSPLMIF